MISLSYGLFMVYGILQALLPAKWKKWHNSDRRLTLSDTLKCLQSCFNIGFPTFSVVSKVLHFLQPRQQNKSDKGCVRKTVVTKAHFGVPVSKSVWSTVQGKCTKSMLTT